MNSFLNKCEVQLLRLKKCSEYPFVNVFQDVIKSLTKSISIQLCDNEKYKYFGI